jgi:hypothetical protein
MSRFWPAALRLMAVLLAAASGLLLVVWLRHAFGRDGLVPLVLATPGPAAQKAVILFGLALMPPLLILHGAVIGRRAWKAADRLRPGVCH